MPESGPGGQPGTGIPTDYSPPVTFDAPRSSSHATVDRGNIKTIGREMSTSFTTLHVTHTNRVAHAVIDAPPINLIGPEFISDLVRLIEYAENSDCRVVVFSSADRDYFIPHVDMTKVREYREAAAKLAGDASIGLLFRYMSEAKFVTIAQIEGRVRGAGSEFILACDMRFAAKETAVFSQIEAAFGLIPGAGAVQHLSRLMGRGRALEAMLGAQDYSADLAERYGWINRSLPKAELGGFVSTLAQRIASFPVEGINDIRESCNAITLGSAEAYRKDSDLFGLGVARPETQARVRAAMQAGLQTRDAEFSIEGIIRVLGNH